MKKFIALIAVVLVAFTLAGCKEEAKDSSATGYGLVHGHYVGVIDLTVDSKKVVKEAKIEEYYLAYNAAQVEETESELAFEVSGKFYAKYYSVDGQLFTSEGELVWSNDKDVSLEEWVKVEANAKAYVEAVKAGKVFIANEDGTKNTELVVTGNAKEFMTKSESRYGGKIWDWPAAMKGVEDILVGTKVDMTSEKNDDGKWVVNDVVTGATLVYFPDYFAVAKRAYVSATK